VGFFDAVDEGAVFYGAFVLFGIREYGGRGGEGGGYIWGVTGARARG